MNEKKIGTRLLFSGNLIKQPYMKDKIFKIGSELKNTEIVMKNSFWVGVYPGLQNEHLDYILENIKSFKN
mgnify:FL=1